MVLVSPLGSEERRSEDSSPAVVELAGVQKVYSEGRAQVVALAGIDLLIGKGELVAVLGPSGSGKSTLLHLVGLLDRPTSGEVIFLGKNAASMSGRERAALRGQSIGFVFQSFHLLPRYSARLNVMLPLLYAGWKRRDASGRAKEALHLVGLSERSEHLPAQLSGGEAQRVGIARAMAVEPALVLADEPTGNLDRKTGGVILDLFSDLNRQKKTTMVIVSHDPQVSGRCHRRIDIEDGGIISDERG
ncbi:MAG: ABC transporter ATP-binding protein [bacterium]